MSLRRLFYTKLHQFNAASVACFFCRVALVCFFFSSVAVSLDLLPCLLSLLYRKGKMPKCRIPESVYDPVPSAPLLPPYTAILI